MKNSRILITGASSGLGSVLFDHYAIGGARVLGVGKRQAGLLKLTHNKSYVAADLATPSGRDKALEKINDFNPNRVIHCLGGGFGLSNDLISSIEFGDLINLNFLVAHEINSACIPRMSADGSGWIVHIGSVASRECTASVGYTVVKSMIPSYVKVLGRRLIAKNIYMSAILPGALTGSVSAMDRLEASKKHIFDDFVKNRRPSGRVTPAQEMIPWVDLLISNAGKLHASNSIILDEAESKAL